MNSSSPQTWFLNSLERAEEMISAEDAQPPPHKRPKRNDLPAVPSPSPNGIFDNAVALVVVGGDISLVRANVLRNVIEKNGGNVVDTLQGQVTHIVTSLSRKKLQMVLEVDCLPKHVEIRSQDWISVSVRIGRQLSDSTCRAFDVFAASAIKENSVESMTVSATESVGSVDDEEGNIPSEDHQETEPLRDEERKQTTRRIFKGVAVDFFGCAKAYPNVGGKSTSLNDTMNGKIIGLLSELKEIYEDVGDEWRTRAYMQAINAISRYGENIRSEDEARKIHDVGNLIAKKVGEIIRYGKVEKLEKLKNDERTQCILQFSRIWGVGSKTAQKWYSLGMRTLDDVKREAALSSSQKIGLQFYEDFQLRIPRIEVVQIEKSLKSVLSEISPSAHIEICGSFRRGAVNCGDVDALISDPDSRALKNLLRDFVERLHEKGILTHDLVSDLTGRGYMGVCVRDPSIDDCLYRRIDIKAYDMQSYPFALLYFTGSAHFNRSMRLLAEKMGYSLSDKGIYEVVQEARQGRVRSGHEKPPHLNSIKCSSEEEIFQFLGLTYRPPEHRNLK